MKCIYSVLLYFSLILLINQTHAKVKKYEKKLINSTTTSTSTIPINNNLKLSIKNSKLILEKFKKLPNNDIKFIKELDKQFNIYGDRVKIKITKINSTTNSSAENGKNKRTINGHIGYGYQQNQPSDSYYFSKPKYQIYPYSQHDIKPAMGGYNSPSYYNRQQQQHQPPPPQHYYQNSHQQQQYQHPSQYSQYKNQMYLPQQASKLHTVVEIEPSQSYELKETTHGLKLFTSDANGYYYQQSSSSEEQPQPHQHQHYEEQVPVIVLRIPGPAKYAAHLQELLQKYLEVRAAEYIKNIQEQHNYYPQHNQQYQQSYQPQQQHHQPQPQPQPQPQQQPEYRQVNDEDTVEVSQHQEKQYWMTEKTVPIVDNADQYSYQRNPQNYVTYEQPEQHQPTQHNQHQQEQEQTTYVYDHNIHYMQQENETSPSIQYVYHPIIRHNITYDDDAAYSQEYQHQPQQPQQPREYSHQETNNYYSNYHASTEEPQQMVYYHHQNQQPSVDHQTSYYQSVHQQQPEANQDYAHPPSQYDSQEEIIQITQKSPIMRLSMASSPSSTEYNYHAHDAAIGVTPRSSSSSPSINHQQHESTKLHPASSESTNDQHYYASTKKRTETRVYQAAPVNNNEQEYKEKVQKLMSRMKKKLHQEN